MVKRESLFTFYVNSVYKLSQWTSLRIRTIWSIRAMHGHPVWSYFHRESKKWTKLCLSTLLLSVDVMGQYPPLFYRMKFIKDLKAASLEPLPMGIAKEHELAAIRDLCVDVPSRYPLQPHSRQPKSVCGSATIFHNCHSRKLLVLTFYHNLIKKKS